MDDFTDLLNRYRICVERFVRFRLPMQADADDILQEVFLTAYQKFNQLKDPERFKAWVLRIAQNKCNDYFRRQAARLELPLEALDETHLSFDRYGLCESTDVSDTLERLGSRERQLLYLYFWKQLPQQEIARRLQIPLGTVKSRLFTAKANFKREYPLYAEPSKGACKMKRLPEFLPGYTIVSSEKAPFPVKWEELMGWFLVPKLGEKLSWGMYDIPSRRCSHVYDMQVTGKARVHGIEGVELTAREAPYSKKEEAIERTFIAQLTDTHCRYLAALRNDGDIRNYITFLDGDAFLPTWGFGEDNCGNETNLAPRGDIQRSGSVIHCKKKDFLLDVVGRYTVTIDGKRFDTICVMAIPDYHGNVVSEQFLDKSGRTILWRRFNRDDWAIDRYKALWSAQLPENERLQVDGETYVHWYDCITDYIL